MPKFLPVHRPSVQCSPADPLAVWRELTGPHSPITLTGSPELWTLAAETPAPSCALSWAAADPLDTAERVALAWLDAGLVSRPRWRVPMCDPERLYALAAIPSDAARALSRAEVDALLADRAPLDAAGAAALPVVTGSVRGSDLLAVAVLARRVLP